MEVGLSTALRRFAAGWAVCHPEQRRFASRRFASNSRRSASGWGRSGVSRRFAAEGRFARGAYLRKGARPPQGRVRPRSRSSAGASLGVSLPRNGSRWSSGPAADQSLELRQQAPKKRTAAVGAGFALGGGARMAIWQLPRQLSEEMNITVLTNQLFLVGWSDQPTTESNGKLVGHQQVGWSEVDDDDHLDCSSMARTRTFLAVCHTQGQRSGRRPAEYGRESGSASLRAKL